MNTVYLKRCRVILGSFLLLFPMFRASAVQDPGLLFDVPVWTNGQVQLMLTGEAGVNYVIESSSDLRNGTPVVTNSDPDITRAIPVDDATNDSTFYRAWRTPLPLFSAALAAKGLIDLLGNNIAVDSFDSADTNYSPGGLYDPTKRKAGGGVVTDAALVNSLSVGNARVMGHVRTGPGTNTTDAGPNGAVGDVNWVSGGTYGIQTNYSATVSKSVTANGHVKFHFDENLMRVGPTR